MFFFKYTAGESLVKRHESGLHIIMSVQEPKILLEKMFRAAVAAAQPQVIVPSFLPQGGGRLVVMGAGKASAAMAAVVEAHWQGDLTGLVVTRDGYAVPCRKIEIITASHPVPDDRSMLAAERMLQLAETLTADDHVLCLISGGGSALMCLPAAGMTLADKQAVNRALLASGAAIAEINTVRRHVSRIKGGRLAAACHPARITNLLISDVPGDDPVHIASGPTVADTTTVEDARAVLDTYKIQYSATWLTESVKPDDARIATVETHIVAAPMKSLQAAAALAQAENIPVHILGDALEGEAKTLGAGHAALAKNIAAGRHATFKAPCILLSGGETTVQVTGKGCGGRNVEYALSLAVGLNGAENIYALAADTDGVDGMADIAGAFVTPDTLSRAHAAGRDAAAALADNDGHGFFGAIGDSLVTGPTQTNVNDFRALFILG
jgi:hydroxypyruvate reductase